MSLQYGDVQHRRRLFRTLKALDEEERELHAKLATLSSTRAKVLRQLEELDEESLIEVAGEAYEHIPVPEESPDRCGDDTLVNSPSLLAEHLELAEDDTREVEREWEAHSQLLDWSLKNSSSRAPERSEVRSPSPNVDSELARSPTPTQENWRLLQSTQQTYHPLSPLDEGFSDAEDAFDTTESDHTWTENVDHPLANDDNDHSETPTTKEEWNEWTYGSQSSWELDEEDEDHQSHSDARAHILSLDVTTLSLNLDSGAPSARPTYSQILSSSRARRDVAVRPNFGW